MNVWMVMFWVVIGVISGSSETDHNGKEHRALCDFLKSAVDKWKVVKTRKPEDPLRRALKDTIFGRGSSEEELETLKTTLPRDYDKVGESSSSRAFFCGKPREEENLRRKIQPRLSGHSAPHDMLCLCTPGDGGWPLSDTEGSKKMLCGKGPKELGVDDDKKGWGIQGKEKNQIQATWEVVVAECLQESGKEINLKSSLDTFMKTLGTPNEKTQPYQSLGEGNFGNTYACSGKETYGVCVKYYPEDPQALPWWRTLNHVLTAEEAETQKQREEEKRKQEDMATQKEAHKIKKSQPTQEPRTAALRSAPQNSQEDELDNTENISNPIATLEDTSGTPISTPSSWLLSASILI